MLAVTPGYLLCALECYLCVTVPGRPEDPQPDQVPAGAAQVAAGDGGAHHPSAELLHQAEGRVQAGRVHHGNAASR